MARAKYCHPERTGRVRRAIKKGRNQTFSRMASQVRDSTISEATVTATRRIMEMTVCGIESRFAMRVENPSERIESWK